jgi:hypothetical protein
MGYEIDYAGMEPAAAADKAVKDVKHWLGVKRFNKIVKILQGNEGVMSRGFARFALSMVGVQGFPAEAMIDRYWNPQLQLDL